MDADRERNQDLELAVIDQAGTHALLFACRRIDDGWTNALTKWRVEVQPTHWRAWTEAERTVRH
jgi:hypothetical protein